MSRADEASPFRVLAISDRTLMGPDPVATARRLWDHRLPSWALQWREKSASPREVYRDLLTLKTDLENDPAILVNDRVDLALALGLHVHLTEQSIPIRVARTLLPAGTWIGRSVHSEARAREAAMEGADYLLFGPIFDTPSKRAYGAPQGLAALAAVAGAVSVPVIAVGGIDRTTAPRCAEHGASGVAAIREIWESDDPARRLSELHDAFVDSL
ncbi:MAG: thiamine phosphate synthase [Candidatus Eisenbacteria bacterium]